MSEDDYFDLAMSAMKEIFFLYFKAKEDSECGWTNQLVLSVYKLLRTFYGSLATIGSRESNPVDQCVCVCDCNYIRKPARESDQRCTIQLLPKSIAIVMFRVPVGVLIGDNCSSETINKAS